MEWVETTGRTVEEAKDSALDELGVDELDAEVEVVDEAKTGLFGRVRAPARVRARVRPTAARPRVKGRAGGQRRHRVSPGPTESDAGLSNGHRTDPGGGVAEEVLAATETGPSPGSSTKAPDGGATPDESGAVAPPLVAKPPGPAKPSASAVETNEGVEMEQMQVSLADQAEIGRQFLVGLIERFDMEGSVEISTIDEETVELAVAGQDIGLLVGPRGETLGALQELTRTVVQRRVGRQQGRLLVDVGGYRRKRRVALEGFVQRIAEDVRASGVAQALEPMGAADRKTIHDTVNDIVGVTTTSEGEEPRRHVVVRPAEDHG